MFNNLVHTQSDKRLIELIKQVVEVISFLTLKGRDQFHHQSWVFVQRDDWQSVQATFKHSRSQKVYGISVQVHLRESWLRFHRPEEHIQALPVSIIIVLTKWKKLLKNWTWRQCQNKQDRVKQFNISRIWSNQR